MTKYPPYLIKKQEGAINIMFFRILQKDLKRKKTMNIIIFLFVTLATMFVASSVNNILAVANGLDYYFEKAGFTQDYFILARVGEETETLDGLLTAEPSVKSYQAEPQTLTVHINRLREKIENDPKKPERIRTVWGTGYKFV